MFKKEMAGSLEMWSSLVEPNQYVEICIPDTDTAAETVYVGQKSELGFTAWVDKTIYGSFALGVCKLKTSIKHEDAVCEWFVHARILTTIPTPAGTRFIFGDICDDIKPTVENAIAVLEWLARMEKRNEQAKV